MKKMLMVLVVVATGMLSGCASAPKPAIEWTGCYPSSYAEDSLVGRTPSYFPGLELGLRDDGVMVWRKREGK